MGRIYCHLPETIPQERSPCNDKAMKITTTRDRIFSATEKVAKIINKKNVVLILDCMLFEVTNGILTITATNNETQIRTSIEVDADGDFAFACPGKLFVDTVKLFMEEKVVITLKERHVKNSIIPALSIEMKNGKSKCSLPCEDTKAFPKMQFDGAGDAIVIESAILRAGLKIVSGVAKKESPVPMYEVVCFRPDGGNLMLYATNGFQIVSTRLNISSLEGLPQQLAVKQTFCDQVQGLLGSGTVTMIFGKRKMRILTTEIEITVSIVEAKYQEVWKLWEQKPETGIRVNRAEILGCLKRSELYVNDETKIIIFEIAPGNMLIRAEDSGRSRANHEEIDLPGNEISLGIGMSSEMIVYAVDSFEEDSIELFANDPGKPMFLQQHSEMPKPVNVEFCIAPMKYS